MVRLFAIHPALPCPACGCGSVAAPVFELDREALIGQPQARAGVGVSGAHFFDNSPALDLRLFTSQPAQAQVTSLVPFDAQTLTQPPTLALPSLTANPLSSLPSEVAGLSQRWEQSQ
jgi:hypothetical protein